MFWENAANNIDANIFIIDGVDKYTFEEIFLLADEAYKDIPSRSIVLVESKRDLGTVIAYLGALRKQAVPLLIDANSDITMLDKLAKGYKADFIFSINDRSIENCLPMRCFQNRFISRRVRDFGENPFSQLALLMPTSGSTGDAKCVRTSYKSLNEVTYAVLRYMPMDATRVSISSLQLHYTYGLSVLNLAIASRSKFVLTSHSWIERDFWSLVERCEVSDLSGVPFMFQILRRIKLTAKTLKNLKCVNQAGGRLEPHFTEYFIDYFASHEIPYFTMYGATEATPRISYVPSNRSKEKLGTVGVPIDIGSLYTDAEDGVSEGQLIYRGPNVCLGYSLCREDLIKGDEFNQVLETGDIGFIDEDGFATIVGRKKRFVKVFGVSLNLDALETIIKNIVSDSVVIGEDDNVKALYVGELSADKIKEEIMSKVTFSHKGLKVISIPEILLNSAEKPDYPRLSREFL